MNTPVSFELAKLLKEKGFDELCKLCVEDGDERPLPFNCGNTIHRNSLHPYYSAPTIAEVVMWLYEKHGIWVHSSCDVDGHFYPKIYFSKEENWFNLELRNKMNDGNREISIVDYNSPTEAYEAAILYTLNNLIR